MGGDNGSSAIMSSFSSFLFHFRSSALRTKMPSPVSLETSTLVRRLSLLDLLLIGIGASIGAGIFVITGTVARDAGPGVTISFIIAGASCVLNALCFAELASRFPAVVGGAYLYTYAAFNELTAFILFMQLMLDYHITAASIARSLASYIVTVLEMLPMFKHNIPRWIGHGGQEFLGFISINLLAPILLVLVTAVLCAGVKESSRINGVMTGTKIVIVIFVIIAGAFEVDVSNWSPFAPNGFKSIMTGATVVFFSYVGFDAVANSAEESKRPQRDLPLGIMGSLMVCVALYVSVCLVITGMVPYNVLGDDAPLAQAFKLKGLKFVSILISIGAVAGLTTTLLVGLYAQSRLYLGVARDGLLPAILAKVHPTRHTPIPSQLLVGLLPAALAGLFNVHLLSRILSVGGLIAYSGVSACVVTLRWKEEETRDRESHSDGTSNNGGGWVSKWREGVTCLIVIALSGFTAGILYRCGPSLFLLLIPFTVASFSIAALCCRQVYVDPPGFYCPWVPLLPSICIFFNIFLFSQLHYIAMVRFVVLSVITVGIYAFYGQYHANVKSSVEGVNNIDLKNQA